MFFIECEEDNPLFVVEEQSVIFTEDIKTGDRVKFFYGTSQRLLGWNGYSTIR